MTKSNQTLAILGCGWLGFPLAKQLQAQGYLLKGSTTTLDKITSLENAKIQPYLIKVTEDKINGNIAGFLDNCDVLIIDIPPKLRNSSGENFVEKIQNLIPHIETSKVSKVLFVSSTSVYGDTHEAVIITEATQPIPTTESGKQLVITEQLLQQNKNFNTTILRFGGLIGKDRHPVKHLAGKENLENPEAPVNLIHQDDCIGIVEKIIENNCFGETLNAVAPFHPTRKEYYTAKAIELNLELPKFGNSDSKGKIIDSSLLINVLQYEYNLDLYS